MKQSFLIRCDCCGLTVDPEATEDCPRCKYPVKPEKEEHFLESSIHDLKRVSAHGGGSLRVDDLLRRYQSRLVSLRKNKAYLTQPGPTATKAAVPAAPVVPTSTTLKTPEIVKVAPMPVAQRAPVLEKPVVAPPPVPVKPVLEKPVVAPPPMPPQPPRRVFSWREFFADQAINIVASVGAFLLLIGSLSFVLTTSNLLIAFLVLFVVHAIFGVTGFVTYRFKTFRFVAAVYSVIFALLVPLVAFALYKLLVGSNIQFSVPVLVAVAATYAAVIYILMAVYQRFIPFAYLGLVALLVADLAVADTLKLNYWWWPSMAMILALPATISFRRGGESTWPFVSNWRMLREPIRYVMYFIVAASLLCLSYMVVTSLGIDFSGSTSSELRFSILSLTLLVSVWTTLAIWLLKLHRFAIVLAFLILASVIALCYALNSEAIGYALAFTGVALSYHSLNRFAGRRLVQFGVLGLGLDIIALVLALAVPLISSPLLPLQLYASAYGMPLDSTVLLSLAGWRTVTELASVGLCTLLVVSITFYRAGQVKAPTKPAWCWLILLSGFLLNWEYSLLVLTINITPVWAFLGMTLVLVAIAVVVRRLYSSTWANPLDVVAFINILLTLSLSFTRGQDTISALLLFFAALLYAVALYQDRKSLLFLPFVFAMLVLTTLLNRPLVMLLLGLFLPLASVVVRRYVTCVRNVAQTQQFTMEKLAGMWEWPLLSSGLIYGTIVSLLNYSHSMGAMQYTFGIHIPIAVEIAALAIAWYAASALSHVKWWLVPSVGFAIGALLIPTNSFWVLLVLTPVLALIGVAVGRFTERVWSLPYYIVAFVSAVVTGYTGFLQDQLLVTSYALLGFAVLAYLIGVIEKHESGLWLMPAFAIWSIIISAAFLGDLYRPPTVALICAALGVAVKYFRLEPLPLFGTITRNRFLRYALPIYATALSAAILTGVYGMFGNINAPFYGAIPDALLIYALVAFAVLLYERQPDWLWLVAGFAVWGAWLAYSLTPYYLFGIALVMALLGLGVGQASKRLMTATEKHGFLESLRQFTWSWPFYVTSIVAAVLIGILGTTGNINSPFYSAIPDALLAYALIAFAILVIERAPAGLIVVAGSAIWGTCLVFELNTYYLFGIALGMALLGLMVGKVSKRMVEMPAASQNPVPLQQFIWSWPFYATSVVAAILTFVRGMVTSINTPFYGAIPGALLIYALVVFAVIAIERRPVGLFVSAGFAIWGTLLALELNAYYVFGIGITMALLGLITGLVSKRVFTSSSTWKSLEPLTQFTWSWPSYVTAAIAATCIGLWPSLPLEQPVISFLGSSMLIFTIVAIIILVVERIPELLVFPAGLAAATIWLWENPPLDLVPLMIAYSLLCLVVFASQFIWKILPPTSHWMPSAIPHVLLGLGGQAVVVLTILGQGGLTSAGVSLLPHVGSGALLELALLLFWYGYLHTGVIASTNKSLNDPQKIPDIFYQAKVFQHWCYYIAGLLCSLVITWELFAFGQTRIDVLLLAPASYLSVIAPFVMRDKTLPGAHWLGQVVALFGALLLLLPSLWFSVTDSNLLPTLVLMGESLALLLLGIATRVRIFILSSASLLLVAALRALFLSTPPALALMVLGVMLVVIATVLFLVRHRLKIAWTQWE